MTDYQNELVMEHLDLVNWVIRTRISVPNRPLLTYDDFYAIGCEAICRAALKYQADSGEFAPFACRYIYNAIIDHCRAMNYRLQRSVDAGFEEGEVLFDLLAHTTVDFEAEVTDDSATIERSRESTMSALKGRLSGNRPAMQGSGTRSCWLWKTARWSKESWKADTSSRLEPTIASISSGNRSPRYRLNSQKSSSRPSSYLVMRSSLFRQESRFRYSGRAPKRMICLLCSLLD